MAHATGFSCAEIRAGWTSGRRLTCLTPDRRSVAGSGREGSHGLQQGKWRGVYRPETQSGSGCFTVNSDKCLLSWTLVSWSQKGVGYSEWNWVTILKCLLFLNTTHERAEPVEETWNYYFLERREEDRENRFLRTLCLGSHLTRGWTLSRCHYHTTWPLSHHAFSEGKQQGPDPTGRGMGTGKGAGQALLWADWRRLSVTRALLSQLSNLRSAGGGF